MRKLFNQLRTNKYWKFLMWVVLATFIALESRTISDLDIFVSAGRNLWDGVNPYDMLYHDEFKYYYSPFFAMLLIPFGGCSNYWLNLGWNIINVFLVYRLLSLFYQWLKSFNVDETKARTILFISICISLTALKTNFHVAQMTIFLLYLMIEGIRLILRSSILLGSAMIALGISIKVFPIVLIPYLIYRVQWKSVLVILGLLVITILIPSLFLGWNANWEFHASWWNAINPQNDAHILDVQEMSYQSLSSWWSALLSEHARNFHSLSYRRHLLTLPNEYIYLIIQASRLLLIGLALYFLRFPPFTKSRSVFHTCIELAYILMIIPLIFPHQQHYGFFLMFPACVVIVMGMYQNLELRNNVLNKVLLLFIFLTMNIQLLVGEYKPIYLHFKILTYGAIAMVVLYFRVIRHLSVWDRDDKISENS